MSSNADADARRLEHLWAGEFGDRYIERNQGENEQRDVFWTAFLAEHPIRDVLEVGCNIGLNLSPIARSIGGRGVTGIDVNANALLEMRKRVPHARALVASARDLPFADRTFDLVFTAGVLIHQSPAILEQVLREVVRCSRKHILCIEYYAPSLTEVPYRGFRGSLHKLDFGAAYLAAAPELRLVARKTPPREVFGDDMTVWHFARGR